MEQHDGKAEGVKQEEAMEQQEHRYSVTYTVKAHPQGLTAGDWEKTAGVAPGKDEAETTTLVGRGVADAIVMCALREDTRGVAVRVFSLNGMTETEVTDEELYKAWVAIAGVLGQSKELSQQKRALAEAMAATADRLEAAS
jgi:hypothetical protein